MEVLKIDLKTYFHYIPKDIFIVIFYEVPFLSVQFIFFLLPGFWIIYRICAYLIPPPYP